MKFDYLLNKQSGLLGVEESTSAHTCFYIVNNSLQIKSAALDISGLNGCSLHTGGYRATGGADAIVFTGGIGTTASRPRKSQTALGSLGVLTRRPTQFTRIAALLYLYPRICIAAIIMPTDERATIAVETLLSPQPEIQAF